MIVVPLPPPHSISKKAAATFKIANLENFMMFLFGLVFEECTFSNILEDVLPRRCLVVVVVDHFAFGC